MALRNQPYLPLYVQDYLTDEKLSMCSWATQGIYIKLLCLLHKSDPYGTILLKQNDKHGENFALNFAIKITRLLPIDKDTLCAAIQELVNEGCLIIDGDRLFQKRMVRDNEISEIRALSGSKGGKKTQNFAKAKSKANTESDIVNEDYILLYKKVVEKFEITIPKGFDDLILEWLKYKSEKRQTYKETGLKTLITVFLEETGGDASVGRAMLDYSMSKNYSGLFKKEKSNGREKITVTAADFQ